MGQYGQDNKTNSILFDTVVRSVKDEKVRPAGRTQ